MIDDIVQVPERVSGGSIGKGIGGGTFLLEEISGSVFKVYPFSVVWESEPESQPECQSERRARNLRGYMDSLTQTRGG